MTAAVASLIATGHVMAGKESVPPKPSPETAETEQSEQPLVQIALLLDTSNSMDGMINQAKSQLWSVINRFASARHNGRSARIQVSIYQYGSPYLGADNGYVRQILPLTTDLDKVSEELFALNTNGGDEYCGWVIKKSTDELAWSPDTSDYKAIFIAGNEPFDQGKVNYKKSCKSAVEKGIIVNTIHCQGGSERHWRDGAQLADGSFFSINADKAVVQIHTPFDTELARLNEELNATYIAYGKDGSKYAERQMKVDSLNSAAGFSTSSQRIKAKAGRHYSNVAWDLVDATENKAVDLEDLPEEDLPEEMKKLDKEGRAQYVAEKSEARSKIQEKIKSTSAQREKYLAEELRKQSSDDDSFGSAVLEAIEKQAEKTGFKFD
jgi:hypothetical protein